MMFQRLYKLAIVFALSFHSLSAIASDWPAAPTVKAKSWILMDARSGQVLVENNAEKELGRNSP